MVKALEQLAEEEQKNLIEEEKQAAEKREKDKIHEESKNTLGCSDVDTPRSESDLKKGEDGTDEEVKDKAADDEDKDDKKSELKESYGVDMMKFGNASIRTKNGTHSPMMGERQFVHLNTIEEEKHETQTSNYVENASEREDSKLLSSNQFRGSNLGGGLDFESDGHKSSIPKLSPDDLDQTMSKNDKRMSESYVAQSPSANIDKVITNIELPDRNCNNEGRLTGRASLDKDN